jgi:hypothetical protein
MNSSRIAVIVRAFQRQSIEALRQTDGSLVDPIQEVGAVTPLYPAHHGREVREKHPDPLGYVVLDHALFVHN